MKTSIRCIVRTTLVAALVPLWTTAIARPAAAEPSTPQEISLLPTYCVGTFHPEAAKTPAQNIVNCGGFMNHFCPTLVLINRLGDYGRPKYERQWLAGQARNEMNYTLKNMTANCPIAADVRAADSRLKIQEMMAK